MTDRRPGKGKIVSPNEAKRGLGRGFLRPRRHEGHRANPTEYAASFNVKRSGPTTEKEIEMVKKLNPRTWRALKGAGLTDEQIYKEIG